MKWNPLCRMESIQQVNLQEAYVIHANSNQGYVCVIGNNLISIIALRGQKFVDYNFFSHKYHLMPPTISKSSTIAQMFSPLNYKNRLQTIQWSISNKKEICKQLSIIQSWPNALNSLRIPSSLLSFPMFPNKNSDMEVGNQMKGQTMRLRNQWHMKTNSSRRKRQCKI